jgi:hypothetical protein
LQFEGTLFEPVTQNGVITLIKGTGVRGIEKQSQSSTVLTISEFSLGGVRYILEGDAAMKDTLSSAGAKALKFDAGQLLEMFVQTAAVYQKWQANSTVPQGPR